MRHERETCRTMISHRDTAFCRLSIKGIRMRFQRLVRSSSTLAGSLAFLAGLAGTAHAASVTVNGTIGALDPVMPVVTISTPNCVSQGTTPVHYDALAFTVDASGSYHFSMASPTGAGSLYLHAADFNPAASLASCLAADNTGDPVEFDFGLTAGTTYFAVPFDDTFAQSGVVYALTISGPGNISLAAAVPEPGNLALFGAGVLALLTVRRTRPRPEA